MSLTLQMLTPQVRQNMVDEINSDMKNTKLYQSSRLSPVGIRDYPALLIQAATSYDETWLEAELNKNGRLNSNETRTLESGPIDAKVPSNAASLLAEGEFNRFYMRGLCMLAIQTKIQNVEIYRARIPSIPRPESQKKLVYQLIQYYCLVIYEMISESIPFLVFLQVLVLV